jgi:ATP-binding cassette, subfamily A (ABC1), member 3
VKIY